MGVYISANYFLHRAATRERLVAAPAGIGPGIQQRLVSRLVLDQDAVGVITAETGDSTQTGGLHRQGC